MVTKGGQKTASNAKTDDCDSDLIDALSSEQEFLVDNCPIALKLVQSEIDRIKSGKKSGSEKNGANDSEAQKTEIVKLDEHVKLVRRIRIPVEEFPKVNFIGRIVGPRGSEVRRLQQMTGAFISIQGRGSTMSKKNRDDSRQVNKHDAFDGDLHVKLETAGVLPEAYSKMASALEQMKQYLNPGVDDEISMRQKKDLGAGMGGPSGPGPRGSLFDEFQPQASPWIEGNPPMDGPGPGGFGPGPGDVGSFNNNGYGAPPQESNYGVMASGGANSRVFDYGHGGGGGDGYVSRQDAGPPGPIDRYGMAGGGVVGGAVGGGGVDMIREDYGYSGPVMTGGMSGGGGRLPRGGGGMDFHGGGGGGDFRGGGGADFRGGGGADFRGGGGGDFRGGGGADFRGGGGADFRGGGASDYRGGGGSDFRGGSGMEFRGGSGGGFRGGRGGARGGGVGFDGGRRGGSGFERGQYRRRPY